MRKLIAVCGWALAAGLLVLSSAGEAEERVTFDSARYLVGSLQQKLAGERGEPIQRKRPEAIQGFLSKPNGAGPFPAIVHLHGCGGLSDERRSSAARQFTDWGYVTLVVDSFTTRGITEACDWSQMPTRQADASGALAFLSALPIVDRERIAIVGYSQGGMVALGIASERAQLFETPERVNFKAAVAYYPLCSAALDKLELPTLVLIGELDDWSPAVECERLAKRLDRSGAPLTLAVLPEAQHSFDSTSASGDGIRHLGHLLRYNAAAARRAEILMRGFLETKLHK